DKSYITQEFADKEADIVYRLKSTAGDVIFYVLLELQSTVDYLMPFRLLLYMVEIWREVFNNTPQNERESKHFRLPAIIPWCCKLSVRLDSNYILLGNSVRTGAICRVSSQLSL
ncbi:MAG: Rpn family recombination-promoting nuclease/putative transposase, partial [Bacillota bacterium]